MKVRNDSVAFLESGSKGLFYICMVLFLGFYEAYIQIWEWGQEWLSCPLDLSRDWSYSRLVTRYSFRNRCAPRRWHKDMITRVFWDFSPRSSGKMRNSPFLLLTQVWWLEQGQSSWNHKDPSSEDKPDETGKEPGLSQDFLSQQIDQPWNCSIFRLLVTW